MLADRGFDIQDSVGICCARVAILAFFDAVNSFSSHSKLSLSLLQFESIHQMACSDTLVLTYPTNKRVVLLPVS